ncbi:MAG: PD40 domain-containing protein [Chitinophagaceae bacterium]|nr:PD40 domain-containing protein [Chitinophagaceae bacterium]
MMKTQKIILVLFLSVIYTQVVFGQSTSKRVYYFNPKFSPDGASIVFESTRDGKSSIYTINPDGSDLSKITDTTFHYGQPAWSTDGKHLVYYGSNHPMQLFINSRKGGEQKQLSTPGFDAYEPVWSSQNVIAFDSRSIKQTPNDIAVINADGTGFTKLTTDEKYDCSSPQWSPDGNKILFQRSVAIRKPWKEITKEEMKKKKQSTEIMIMNADGSDIHNLVSNLEGEVAPFWSHDGKFIYYLTKQDTAHILYRMPMGKNKSEPMLTLFGVIYSVSISPNGKYIAYAAERNKKSCVYVMNLKKKAESKLIGD